MEKTTAQNLVREALQSSFNRQQFVYLVKNTLNYIEEAPFVNKGSFVFRDFADSIKSVERIGKYEDPEDKLIDILIVHLQKQTSLERARTRQRNFVAKYLKGFIGAKKIPFRFDIHNGLEWIGFWVYMWREKSRERKQDGAKNQKY